MEDNEIEISDEEVDAALKVLNEYHHRCAEWSPLRWVRYKDCTYISGVTMTKKKRGKYAGDHDSVLDLWLSDFEAVAIAEAYQRRAEKGKQDEAQASAVRQANEI